MKQFSTPEVEIVTFENEDIITASGQQCGLVCHGDEVPAVIEN